jgi:hypothetical protein
MANETLSKGYEPVDVEERWLEYWKTHQSFTLTRPRPQPTRGTITP